MLPEGFLVTGHFLDGKVHLVKGKHALPGNGIDGKMRLGPGQQGLGAHGPQHEGQLHPHLLLLVAMVRLKGGRQKRLRAVLIVSIMFLLALGEWLVRPMMEAARLPDGTPGEGFAALHGVSALLYLLASLACVFLVAARIPSVTAAADE